jgi:SSS family solute:Na+ symporter
MNALTLFSGSACLGLVALISWRLSRGHTDTSQGFFLAGRSLTAPVIAGSLLMTNLSTEQMVGLAGSAYGSNMSSMAWEVTAGLACIVMALVLLPRYLASGYTTLPQFLESRFDARVRRASAALFVLGYTFITLPAVLYSGSMAVLALSDLQRATGFDHDTALLFTLLAVAFIGGAFAVAGGLRAIAISDTLFGIGLLVMGCLVPLLGLIRLGEGSMMTGLHILRTVHPEKLNAIGASTDPTPIATVFTGMLLANLFYWGTNQYVIQRVLGAKSLAEGQKGVLLSGFFKLLVPLLLMIPGVIAFHLYGDTLPSIDAAYPTLAQDVLPLALHGAFLAIVLGLVVSSFNSLVNSAATLISIDLMPAHSGHTVGSARAQSVVLVGVSVLIALQLPDASEGLWQLIRRFTGFYNIPVITLVLIALLRRNLNPDAALSVIFFHIVVYGWCTFVQDPGIHFVHLYAVLFIAEAAMLLLWPAPARMERMPATAPAPVDMSPWRGRHLATGLLILCILGLYVLFSPAGIAA